MVETILSINSFLQWNAFSHENLNRAEDELFSHIKVPSQRYFVSLKECVGNDDKIWTVELNAENEDIPIVILHGFGAGIGYWCLNFETLAKNHHVYAFDILGLARSSRPQFSNDAETIEAEFVRSIERWREVMNIEKFLFVAHSWGAYLAISYALKYPQRLEHLLLVDPWGLDSHQDMSNFKWWKVILAYSVRLLDGLFSPMRILGPFGNYFIKFFRPDIINKFNSIVDPSVMQQYIFQCNSNSRPTGEYAFQKMTTVGPWPKNPIGERMKMIEDELPITFIYGEGLYAYMNLNYKVSSSSGNVLIDSWVSKKYGSVIKNHRACKKSSKCYTEVKIISNAGHHVYADNPDEFNSAVLSAFKTSRSKRR